MAQTRMSAIGWVVGGAQTVVTALLEALGPAGTLLAYVGWDDNTGGLATPNASAPGRARRSAAAISGGWRPSARQQAG
jgi:Aminoglycoside 3-N-acetyltransferase